MKMEMRFLFQEEMEFSQLLTIKSIQNRKQTFNSNFWVNLVLKRKIRESRVSAGFQKIV